MKQKFQWLNREVAKPGPYLTLCLSEAELRQASKGLTDEKLPYPKTGAMCSTFTKTNTNELCAIVSLSESAQKRDSIELAALLVHEAVHVWQAYAEHMGETNPADEQEAYAIQSVSMRLMAEYARRLHG
jgi:hypothetical protein